MKYTVYKITNKVNGRFYIGCHKTDNLEDGYMGSGKILKRAIKKYGVENFEKEILEVFNNSEDMFLMEKELVNPKDSNSYNIKEGGSGGFDYINDNELNRNYTRDTRLLCEYGKRGARKSNTKENNKKRSELMTQSNLNYIREHGKSKFEGMKHTQSSKDKIGIANSKRQKGKKNSQYGTRWIFNPINKKNKKIPKDQSVPQGWKLGRITKF